jgi:hypothetical protein
LARELCVASLSAVVTEIAKGRLCGKEIVIWSDGEEDSNLAKKFLKTNLVAGEYH